MSEDLGSGSKEFKPQFKAFESEAQIEEKKKKRQEEWEKVRTADQPIEAPEEKYDPRSLFEQLQSQKDKKQADFEEAHKLKNLIRGLDDEEVAFLELVDKTKIEMESKIIQEERSELDEYRRAVAKVSEAALEAKLQNLKRGLPLEGNSSHKKSQQNLLSQAVKRKSEASTTQESKLPKKDSDDDSGETKEPDRGETKEPDRGKQQPFPGKQEPFPSSLKCLGILPGLGIYTDSSDSENSSLSDNEEMPPLDLLGRRRQLIQVTTQSHNHTG